jgi:hypothetical protein
MTPLAPAQHLGMLLASPYPEVVEMALQTLTSFLKKTHHASIRWHGNRDVNSRLMDIAHGWDTIDEVNGHCLLHLLTCLSPQSI